MCYLVFARKYPIPPKQTQILNKQTTHTQYDNNWFAHNSKQFNEIFHMNYIYMYSYDIFHWILKDCHEQTNYCHIVVGSYVFP